MTTAAAQEAYLRGFHAGDRAGITSRVFAAGDCGDGRSSYDHLIDAIAGVSGTGTGTILDLACGDGYLIERLGVARAIGLDLSAGELAVARARLGPEARLVQARAQAMPLASGSVAAAVSHLAFMLMPDPQAVAAELARVIAPGGRFAAIVGGGPPAEREAFGAYLELIGEVRATAIPALGDKLTRSREGWEALFGAHGFAIEAFDRLEVDVGHTIEAAWLAVSSMYGIAELDAGARAELEARTLAAWEPYITGDRVRCAFVMWLAVASRAPAAG